MLPTENGCTVRWSIPAVCANGWSISAVHNLRPHSPSTISARSAIGCDHISTKGTPFITPGSCAPPKPSQTLVQFPTDETGTGSREEGSPPLKIAAKSSERTDEEMAASGGLWQRAGGRRLTVAAAA
ncbi:hypothetical protein Fot_39438 [Forsythia ovata]|uniref:Uncharacterized protein n=1 Tax=Forsythia ovata TaxID=205694 RepID=A0ABD1S4K4_9LAMI